MKIRFLPYDGHPTDVEWDMVPRVGDTIDKMIWEDGVRGKRDTLNQRVGSVVWLKNGTVTILLDQIDALDNP